MKRKVILFGIVGMLVLLAIFPVFAEEAEEREFKNSAGLLVSISPVTPLLRIPTIVYERTLSTNWGIEGRFSGGQTFIFQGYLKRYLKPNSWIGGGIGTSSGLFNGTILSCNIGYKKPLEQVLSRFGITSSTGFFSKADIQWGLEIYWLSGEWGGSPVSLPSVGAFGAVVYKF